MRGTLYAFAEDLLGEGIGAVLDRTAGYGLDGVSVALAYHRARDVTPHGASRITVRHDGVHFPPGDGFGRLVPPVRDTPAGFTGDLLGAAADRGLEVHGWTVFLHNTTLGLAHPEVTTLNCFGEHGSPADLCPADPDVRAYAVALGRAVARQGVTSVVAEALHYGTFGHGYHHERDFTGLGPLEQFVLGLCFCAGCAEHAGNIDVATVRRRCAGLVGAVLDGGPAAGAPLTLTSLSEWAGEEVTAYALSRVPTVTGLAAEVAHAVAAEGSRLVFMDATGACKGYGDGLPQGGPAAGDAWQLGVDPAAVSEAVPGYAVLAYARDPERVALDVGAYRDVLADTAELRAVLRPGRPDTDTAETLRAKVKAASAADAVDFYAYGLLPLPVLDRIA